jgi:GntR family transcriptional regulator
MEFYIEKHSTTPVVSQIEEQIKIAVMMGAFRNGDTLPSIRDIEKQTGVNRSQIHKAYLSLRRSGLLVLMRGKGTVVVTATDTPRSFNENCRKLSKKIISRTRQLGISPTAFARYLSRQAQEDERCAPLLMYVDIRGELAEESAVEISQLWQVPVVGMAFQDLKNLKTKSSIRQKILASHLMYEAVRSLFPKRKPAIIPIKVRYSEQTIKRLQQIEPDASVLLVLLPQASYRASFLVSQVRNMLKSQKTKVELASVSNQSDFRALIKDSPHDYYIVGPGARGEIPRDLRQNPRIVQLNTQLDPASLEAARIRAGVVI